MQYLFSNFFDRLYGRKVRSTKAAILHESLTAAARCGMMASLPCVKGCTLMRNKNVWIMIGIIALIALTAALGLLLPRRVQVDTDAPSLNAELSVVTPSGESITPEVAAAPTATATATATSTPTAKPTAAPKATATPIATVAPTATATATATSTPTAKPTATPTATATPDATATAAPTATPGTPAAVGPVAEPAVKAYLLVTVRGVVYQPIPLTEEGEYTVKQGTSGMENVIHVTPTSVNMKSSTCDNQDCVQQGEVTLKNMKERILGNMIICLPNEVTLELYTPEGLMELLGQQ